MGWEIPLDDVDTDNLEGFDYVKPGGYHVMVQSVTFDSKNQMVVDYEVLHGTLTSEIGKSHRDYFQSSAKALKRAFQFAIACGITTQEELDEMKKQRRPFSKWMDAVGKHLKIVLDADEYQGKVRSKCGFGIYSIDSPKAKDIPVNKGALEKSPDQNPFDGGGGGGDGGTDSPPVDDDPFAS